MDTSRFPALDQVQPSPASLGAALAEIEASAGTVLFDEGTACAGFPLVLEGEIAVSRSSADGRALELYRVVPGEICLVSSASLFRGVPMSARGFTVRTTRLVLVPPTVFFQWLGCEPFRTEVLGMFADRMADLTALVDAVAFRRLDERLAEALLGHGTEIHTTHQRLAERLGTVREIVTRVLRGFEREGWIAQSREHIRILDGAALRERAAGRR